LRRFPQEAQERASMASVVPPPEERPPPSPSAQISTLIVQTLREYSGRGPTKAYTVIGRNSVHCIVGDSLTTAERTLANAGHEDGVITARKQMQEAMRSDLVSGVEKLMDRKVIAFMSDNHIDPDYGIESFILEPQPDSGVESP
jgi:uncharacterized protein YbcI